METHLREPALLPADRNLALQDPETVIEPETSV
jgi:hypothetical protein